MMILLFQRASPAELERLMLVLGRPRSERVEGDVRWIRERMDAHGCIEDGRRSAHALAGAACHEFRTALGDLPDSRDKRFLGDLAHWILHRG